MKPSQYIFIALGGAIGTILRYFTYESYGSTSWPYATLSVNLLGALLIGFFVTFITERIIPNPKIRPFLAIGVLGAFTTESTFALDTYVMIHNGKLYSAIIYLLVTIVGGLAAVSTGIRLGRVRLVRKESS